MRVTNIHRVLEFEQSDFKTEKRKQATNKFGRRISLNLWLTAFFAKRWKI